MNLNKLEKLYTMLLLSTFFFSAKKNSVHKNGSIYKG